MRMAWVSNSDTQGRRPVPLLPLGGGTVERLVRICKSCKKVSQVV